MVNPTRCLRLPFGRGNMLIARRYALTDVFLRKIGRGIASGVNGDEPLHFLLRKKLTSRQASQLQADFVAVAADKGVLAVEGAEEAVEAVGVGGGGVTCREDGSGGERGGLPGSGGCGCRRLGGHLGHREGFGFGMVVRFGVPGVEAGLRQRAASRVVGMPHVAADGVADGGIDARVALPHVVGAYARQDFHPFAGDADEGGDDPRQLSAEALDVGGAVARVVEVDAGEVAGLPQVGHGMSAEADACGHHAGHSVLDDLRLCLRGSSGQALEAAVLLHLGAEASVPQLLDELFKGDGLCAFAPHVAEFGKPDGTLRRGVFFVLFHNCFFKRSDKGISSFVSTK